MLESIDTFIGIDPGKNGAIVVLNSCREIICSSKFSESTYRIILSDDSSRRNAIAIVEDVHAMPKQGVTSMFSFGHNKGFIEGLLYAYNIPYCLVSPQKWKRFFGLTVPRGTSKIDIKDNAITLAKNMFPHEDFLATPRCKKPHDGLCEATLMAMFLRQLYNSKNFVPKHEILPVDNDVTSAKTNTL